MHRAPGPERRATAARRRTWSLGAVDVTGRYDTATPHTLALVQIAARLVEERLRADMFARDARILTLFAEHTHRFASRPTPAAALSPSGRVLADHPDGLDARSLSELLYGEAGHEVAVRSELHRLRDVLDPALGTRPYRLEGVRTELQTLSAGADRDAVSGRSGRRSRSLPG